MRSDGIIGETDLVTLRVFERADSAHLYEFLKGPATQRLMPHLVIEHQTAAMQLIDEWRRADELVGHSMWAVLHRSTGRLMGICGFDCEPLDPLRLELMLDIKYTKSSYASEAARAATTYAFEELGASSILVSIRSGNSAGFMMAHRLGLVQVERTADEHGALVVYRMDNR